MDRLRDKMQFAAMMIFLLIFGAIFILGMDSNAVDTNGGDMPRSPTSSTEIEQESETTSTETVGITTTLIVEQTETKTEPEKQYVYYDVPLDDDLQEYIQDICEEYGLDRCDIIIALIEKESSYREDVISKTNDYGYMQINGRNHEWLSEELGINDFLDGEQNILAGVYILSELYAKYEDIGLALMCYNCGEKGANNLWMQGIYSTEYSRTIMKIADGLELRN